MSSSPPVIRLDLSHQKLLVHPDDPLPIFYPPPEAVMVVPVYDKRDVYRSRSWSPSDDDRRGYSRGRSRHGHSSRGHRDEYHEPRHRSRRDSYQDDYDDGHYPRSASHGRYHGQQPESESSYSAYGPERGGDSDLSRSRPPGQGPAHPMSVTGHINPQSPSQSHSPSSYGQQAHHQQAYSSSGHGKPSKTGFFANVLGAALSQGSHSHSPSQNGHAAQLGHAASQGLAYAQSHGYGPSQSGHAAQLGHAALQGLGYAQSHGYIPSQSGHAASHSHGGHGKSNDPLQGMNLPPATRALLKYAQERGILDDLTNYFQKLPPSRDFTYSKCTGKKKAVCIGINYTGQRDELKGCANDARNMRDFLIRNYGFQSQNIVLLIDDEHTGRGQLRPTRDEMFNAMNWLIKDASAHDSLFFHYSGHGGQSPDASGKELDGMDEVIFPMDYDQGAGDIIDDELHDALVCKLNPGVRLTAVFDSCHSGTVLDLPYLHSAHGRLRSMGHISMRAQKRGACDSADVICLAACKDDEKSTDTREGGVAVGAMSWAFIQALERNKNQTYEELLHYLRSTLVPKYNQKAQISGTHPVDMSRQFML